MSSWIPVLAVGVAVVGLLLTWLTFQITSAKWHKENEPVLSVEAYWAKNRIPHVAIEHLGPAPLARIELEVLLPRAGTKRAGLLTEADQEQPVSTRTVNGPIRQGEQRMIRVSLEATARGREMNLRMTSYPERSSMRWRRWLRIGQRGWVSTSAVTFHLPAKITTASKTSRIPTQVEALRRQK